MDKQFMKKVLAQRPTLSLLPFSITKISGCSHFIKTNSSKIVDENGNKYYDHKLSRIEKGKLLDSLSGITTPGFNQKESLSSVGKDIRFTYSLSAKFL